jgi:hypothetical protein
LTVCGRGESMPARPEVLGDGTRSGKESLGVSGGLEPLHVSLPLTSWLMRILRAVVQIPMLAMFHPWENLALGGCVALQFVGDDYTRDVGQAFEELAEELLRGALIPAALHQDIEHVPVLIHSPPQIVAFSLNSKNHFIEMPFIARPRTAATELIGVLLAKLAAPLANGFIG